MYRIEHTDVYIYICNNVRILILHDTMNQEKGHLKQM